jgi:hypothetical protein
LAVGVVKLGKTYEFLTYSDRQREVRLLSSSKIQWQNLMGFDGDLQLKRLRAYLGTGETYHDA